jgi:hypothetical protein
MKNQLAVIVPTLGRPHAIAPLVEAFARETPVDHRLVFLADVDDVDTHDAVNTAGGFLIVTDVGTYPRKVNEGVQRTTEPWMLIGADDILPHRGWWDMAMDAAAPRIGVISPNDLGNRRVMRGEYATLPIVARWYSELGSIDNPHELYHSGYAHNGCDWEFSETAQYREAYVYAPNCIVEHLHPHWGKARHVPDPHYHDATYLKQVPTREADDRLVLERRHLWGR